MKYLDFIRDSHSINLFALKERVRREHNLIVSINKVFRARKKALGIIKGKDSEHYGMLRRYCIGIIKYNPGSTMKLHAPDRVF